MSSTALPGKLNDEGECDLVFYKQEHRVFRMIGRCIRYGAGVETCYETMPSILDGHHQCWMQLGPAEVLYYDGEGALNDGAAKAALKAEGAALRMRARGQRATTMEVRNDISRHLLHFTEAELNR
eukprot:4425072-Pyramimonas_sp.AAC.1